MLDDNFLLGRVLAGRYELRAHLGTGGMASTYLGRNVALGSPVAVKVLHADKCRDPAVVARFHVEALAASRLSHPNIVAVLDAGVDGELAFLVMEYVRGRTLRRLATAEGPLPLARIGMLMDQLLRALQEVHAEGFIHGDVKSDNVLVTTGRDGVDILKLADFGLAHPRGAVPDEELGVCGTPEYLAPEVISGAPAEVPADVYGAGAILYELLTGLPPFTGRSPHEVMERRLAGDVVPPSVRAPERSLTAAIDDVALLALAADPQDRFADAAALRTALDSALGGCPEAVTATTTTHTKFVHHEPVPVHHTANLRDTPTARMARGSGRARAVSEHDSLRAHIGRAIAAGDTMATVGGYLELAIALARNGQTSAAVAELEEGFDVVTCGEGQSAARVPPGAWRLVALLAYLQRRRGRTREASAAAAAAVRLGAPSAGLRDLLGA